MGFMTTPLSNTGGATDTEGKLPPIDQDGMNDGDKAPARTRARAPAPTVPPDGDTFTCTQARKYAAHMSMHTHANAQVTAWF